MKATRLVDGQGRAREVRIEGGSASLDGRTFPLEIPSPGEIVVDGRHYRVASAREGSRIWVWCEGAVYEFETGRKGRSAASAEHHAGGLAAPMPGRVRRLVAAPGASVGRGDVLLVLEAMKMEHAIRAPHGGVLERFHVAEGDLVEAGVELAEIAAEDASGGSARGG
jgi:3-methylcrotonyl-CoA carboxylase alpha subunit